MSEISPDPKPEPPDHHVYNSVSFDPDTIEFYLTAFQFYESLLDGDLKAAREDPDLRAILGDKVLESYPIAKELKRVQRFRLWLEEQLKKADDVWGIEREISHGIVRFVKSVASLYLEHLHRRRDLISSRPMISKSLLEAVDQQIARFDEKTRIGIFRDATKYPLALNQLPPLDRNKPADSTATSELRPTAAPRPVVLESIEIRDPILRKRCLDLFAQFREDGEHERLDTVVNEATRILEDRLRLLSGAPTTCVGVDLAKYAFAGPSPQLIVSDISSEQEAAHLLYRGVFGLVRNSVHHRLVGTLQPERVLQVVGMIDYLVSVAEAARLQQD
jgi:hypothetical protein